MASLDELIDYVENFDHKGINLAILGTPTRSGSFLLHSLLDSHDQILQIPVQHFFYFDWQYLEMAHADPESWIDRYQAGGFALVGKKKGLGPNCDISIDIQYAVIFDRMREAAQYIKPLSRKKLFLLFYFVYAQLRNQDLSKLKLILHHSHYLNTAFGYDTYQIMRARWVNLEALETISCRFAPAVGTRQIDEILDAALEDFPKLKMLVTIREPMAGTYSFLKHLEGEQDSHVLNASDLSSFFNRSFYSLISGYSVLSLQERLGIQQCKLVQFEALHTRTRALMMELSEYLSIDFQESLLESTFWGHQWNAQDVTRGKQPLTGTDPERIQKTPEWKTGWDPQSRVFFARLTEPLAEAWGYEVDTETAQAASGADLPSSLLPQEAQIYTAYLPYLASELHQSLEQQRAVNSQPVEFLTPDPKIETQLQAFQEKTHFWRNYRKIRNLAIKILLQQVDRWGAIRR